MFASEGRYRPTAYGDGMDGESAGEPTWRTARRCDGGQCVEVGVLAGYVLIRSSADRSGGRVTLSRAGWQMFVDGVKGGDLDSL